MDARTVLACRPTESADPAADPASLSWVTEHRTENAMAATLIDLHETSGWRLRDGMIEHETGGYFSIIGLEVTAHGREVKSWHQPMLAPSGTGLVGLLVSSSVSGTRVLLRARIEPGCTDGVELGPTVQYQPDTIARNPGRKAPPLISQFADPSPDRLLYDVEQSEEGGRYYFARNRYMVVAATEEFPAPQGFRWFDLTEVADFVRHSFYLNIQARSVLLCLQSLMSPVA